jgi:hypothetical protein
VAVRRVTRSEESGRRRGADRLGVLPAQFVPRTPEEDEAIRRALRALYREHFERTRLRGHCNDPTEEEEEA